MTLYFVPNHGLTVHEPHRMTPVCSYVTATDVHTNRAPLLQLVGQEVSKMFRKEVSIKNLPPLVKKPKASRSDAEASDLGLSVLFQSSPSTTQTPISH